ncbi:PTS sorbitol transporter subunit IIA [Thermoanaerobacteraceae bacterium SP2]|nr:PTS sorbitol transporter subunit IIA [Thermoanaerobacteraceae bacterium SP2]
MVVFESVIDNIGENGLDFLCEKMVILFNNNAPIELAKFSVLIKPGKLLFPIERGDIFTIGELTYKVTAIGKEANKNLNDLGHVVLKFDGEDLPSLPGNIHLEAKELPKFTPGLIITFRKG